MFRWQICVLALFLSGAPLFATTFPLPLPTRPTSFPLPLPQRLDEGRTTTVVAWGLNSGGQSTVPAGLIDVVQVSAGSSHTVALQSDGTVVAWGGLRGQSTVPAGLVDVVQVSAGSAHTVALKSDGTVAAWGNNFVGQSTVPAGLVDVVQVSAGSSHTVALKSDGTVVAWGANDDGQTTVPAGLVDVVQVSAGRSHTVALKSDGSVVAWGLNSSGQAGAANLLTDGRAGGWWRAWLNRLDAGGNKIFGAEILPESIPATVEIDRVILGVHQNASSPRANAVVFREFSGALVSGLNLTYTGTVEIDQTFPSGTEALAFIRIFRADYSFFHVITSVKTGGAFAITATIPSTGVPFIQVGLETSGPTGSTGRLVATALSLSDKLRAGLVDVVQVSAGSNHTIALRMSQGLTGAATKSPYDPATAVNWSSGGSGWIVDTSVSHDGYESVKARTTDGQSTYREYIVTGPAAVDFWWKVSSEERYDTFAYSISGVNQQTISGEVDWTYRTLTLPEGTHTIRWTYTKDGSDSVGQDAGWLDDLAIYPATATLQVRDGATVLNGEVTVDFSSADSGSAGFTKSLTFVNDGYVPLEVALSLPEGSPFTFEGGVATSGLLIGRGGSVDVPITLSNDVRGATTARLTISAPGSTATAPQVTLVVGDPSLQVRDGATVLNGEVTVDFGAADLGSAGFPKLLTFVNDGYVPLEVALSLPEGSPFTFEGGVATSGLLIGRGGSVDVPITLSKDVRGATTARLTISAPGSTTTAPQVTLVVGAPSLQVRDGATVLNGEVTVDFGSADLGGAGFTKSLTFANDGYVPLEVELSLPEGSPFTFEGGVATSGLLIGRGGSVDVPITLSTEVYGSKAVQLAISAPGSTATAPQITLTGDVLGPVIGVGVRNSSVALGQTIDLGLAPRTLQFTISNVGRVGNLEITQIFATGNFQIAAQLPTLIAPQTSTTFTVLAQGGVSGLQSGAVTITSNDTFSENFTINLTSNSLFSIGNGITTASVTTSGIDGAAGWDFGATQLPSGENGVALKTGATPNNAASILELTTQAAGVLSWTWKISAQENFDWLLCHVDGQEVAGISAKGGAWQTQVVNVPAGANVRWVYRKDASGSAGEDAGYLADVEFRSFAANQSFSKWAQTNGITDPQQRMPKSGMQAMFGWLGGIDPVVGTSGRFPPHFDLILMPNGNIASLLLYRFSMSKTADGTQQILYSSDMSSWTTRRISQRVVSEDADRVIIEATAPSGTKGFFKVVGSGDMSGIMVGVQGGTLPQSSGLAGTAVATFQIGKTEVMWGEWQAVRTWSVSNGYDLAGVGQGSGPGHPVREVNWYEALKWCNAKSEMEGYTPVYSISGAPYRTGSLEPTINPSADGYRLPTEAEWEWAARGGVRSNGYIYSGSNDLDAVAWYRTNSLGASAPLTPAGRGTWPARSKVANELGLYDMNGNTWEWCWDGGGAGGRRIRGGSFINQPFECDLHHRGYIAPPSDRGTWRDLGFRVARDVEDGGNASVVFVGVQGGSLPQSSGLAGAKVSDFRIGKTEVTWAEWEEVRDWAVANGYSDLTNIGGGSGPNHPVRNVNWYDVAKWCNAKSEKENLNPVYLNGSVIYKMGNIYAEPDPSANGYRLPTEVEWEWAARGGTISQNYIYVGSNDLNLVGWYHENSVGAPLPLSNGRGTWPVGMKQPNELGLYDMSGNVVEWCFDSVNGNGENRRFRGGSWGWTAEYCTVGSRYWFFGTINRASDVGFRLARNAD